MMDADDDLGVGVVAGGSIQVKPSLSNMRPIWVFIMSNHFCMTNLRKINKTRPKIGLKWCARGALLIFLVIFTKAIHILMLYLGFWHATEWSIALCLKIAHVLPRLLSFWHLFLLVSFLLESSFVLVGIFFQLFKTFLASFLFVIFLSICDDILCQKLR